MLWRELLHAIEARIYAEDPAKDFAARPGEVKTLRWPTLAPGSLRIESAIAPGSKVHRRDQILQPLFSTPPHNVGRMINQVLVQDRVHVLFGQPGKDDAQLAAADLQ